MVVVGLNGSKMTDYNEQNTNTEMFLRRFVNDHFSVRSFKI